MVLIFLGYVALHAFKAQKPVRAPPAVIAILNIEPNDRKECLLVMAVVPKADLVSQEGVHCGILHLHVMGMTFAGELAVHLREVVIMRFLII